MVKAQPTEHENEISALYHKINWRILFFLLICYGFAFLDRVNIGFAKLHMQKDIGITDAVYGLGAGIFFIGYVLFEIPSNLLLVKIGARRTLSRILLLWGLTSASMLFVTNAHSFYLLRFFLGIFEAGFAPGMIFYLTYWYSSSRMATAFGTIMLVIPIGGMLGGPLSTWIMTAFSGIYGLHGWQWLFIMEGLPSVVLGIISFFFITDKPAQAKWLSPHEKELLAAEISQPVSSHSSFRQVLRDARVYSLAFVWFTLACGVYLINFWLPTMISRAGIKDTMHIGLYSAIPYAAAAVCMITFGRSSDRHHERRWHFAILAFLGATTLGIATLATSHFALFLVCITLATGLMQGAYVVLWAMPSEYIKGDAAAGAVALINSVGLIGGFLSPSIIGWSKTVSGSLNTGIFVLIGLLFLGSMMIGLVNPGVRWQPRNPEFPRPSQPGEEPIGEAASR